MIARLNVVRRRPFAAPIAGLLIAAMLAGCPGESTDEPAETAAASDEAQRRTQQRREDNCETTLDAVLDAFSPRRVDDDIEVAGTLSDLNTWLKSCGKLYGSLDEVADDAALRERVLPPDVFALTGEQTFAIGDAEHIAETLLAREIVDAVASDTAVPSQAEAAERLVGFTAQQIVSLPIAGGAMPLPPRRLWQLGFGGRADRARLAITLLRQRRIDAAIVALPVPLPDGRTGSQELLGVAVDDAPQPDGGPAPGVLLFDTRAGEPLRSPGDPDRIATLAEAAADPQVFRQYDLGGAVYPATADRVPKRKIKFAGNAALLAPRMGLVQLALPPERRLELYDSLGQSALVGEGSGLIARLERAFDTPAERIELWTPSLLSTDASSLEPALQQVLGQQIAAILGPVTPVQEEPGGPWSLQPVANPLRLGRIEQLAGDAQKATPIFLKARLAADPLMSKADIPPQLQEQAKQINAGTGTDAQYWAALMQAQLGNADAAMRQLTRFLEQNPQSLWRLSAQSELARLLAESGQTEQAIAVMQAIPPQLRTEFDLHRLQRLGVEVPTTEEVIRQQQEARDRAKRVMEAAERQAREKKEKEKEEEKNEAEKNEAETSDEESGEDDASDGE